MNQNLLGMGHVAYTTNQMDEMLHFYCDILGMEHAFSLTDKDGVAWIEYVRLSGEQFIEFFYAKDTSFSPVNTGSYQHLCLQVHDLHEMDAYLRGKGIDVFYGPAQGEDLNWQCWARDPDGNPIEFMQLDPRSPQYKAAHKNT